MATIPVYLETEGQRVRVGYAEAEWGPVTIDSDGPRREFYDRVSAGPAVGFQYGD